MSARLLVVDDHEEVVSWLVEELQREGYAVEGVTSALQAAQRAADDAFDLVIADIEMPELRGIELMHRIHRARPGQLVLLITAFGSVDLAVQAVRAGACDFVTKPFSREVLVLAIERALRERTMRREIVRLRRAAGATESGVVARSDAMRAVLSRAERAARVDSSVLVTGETGVGKGTVARYIHACSKRQRAPFVGVNCGAMPTHLVEAELFGVKRGAYTDAREDRDGLLVRAHGGSIFLDEIGELPADAQPKLLGFVESGRVRPLGGDRERTVDVRIVAATNRDLAQAVREKTFRADLLFRLDVIRIEVPPLRERPEDIDPLVDQLIETLSARMGRTVVGVTEEGMEWLRAYPWPGNVRELGNVIERAIALGEEDVLTLEDLRVGGGRAPADAAASGSLDAAAAAGLPLEDVELAYIRRVVEACDGNMSEAARRLGIDRRTLYRRLGATGA